MSLAHLGRWGSPSIYYVRGNTDFNEVTLTSALPNVPAACIRSIGFVVFRCCL